MAREARRKCSSLRSCRSSADVEQERVHCADERHLAKVRRRLLELGSDFSADISPKWAVCQWIRYWLRFCIEWPLIWIVCAIGLLLSTFGYIRLQMSVCIAQLKAGVRLKLAASQSFDNSSESEPKVERSTNSLGVVIPTFNAASNIERTLLFMELNASDRQFVANHVDVYLVDGGSIDNTLAIAKRVARSGLLTFTLHIVDTDTVDTNTNERVTGRGLCQRIGVDTAIANGSDMILLLRSDTLLSFGWAVAVRRVCADASILLGSFTFAVDRSAMRSPTVGVGCVECFTRLRSECFWLPYGDQSYFFHATVITGDDFEESVSAKSQVESEELAECKFNGAIDSGSLISELMDTTKEKAKERVKVKREVVSRRERAVGSEGILGQLPDTCCFEDFILTAKSRRIAVEKGLAIHINAIRAHCSPRRWARKGVFMNTLLNQWLVFCFTRRGFTPEQLYELYHGNSFQ